MKITQYVLENTWLSTNAISNEIALLADSNNRETAVRTSMLEL